MISTLGLAVRFAWDLGWIIAIPVTVFGFGGAYLDKALKTSPLFLLTGLLLALILSITGVFRQLKTILKKRIF